MLAFLRYSYFARSADSLKKGSRKEFTKSKKVPLVNIRACSASRENNFYIVFSAWFSRKSKNSVSSGEGQMVRGWCGDVSISPRTSLTIIDVLYFNDTIFVGNFFFFELLEYIYLLATAISFCSKSTILANNVAKRSARKKETLFAKSPPLNKYYMRISKTCASDNDTLFLFYCAHTAQLPHRGRVRKFWPRQ